MMKVQVAMTTYGPTSEPLGFLPSLNGLYLTHLPAAFFTKPGGHLPPLFPVFKPAPAANAAAIPEFLLAIVKS